VDDTDEHDDDVAEDDREGVDATSMDVDKDEGEGEGSRCCNALHDAVAGHASFLGGNCVDAAPLVRSLPASGSAVFIYTLLPPSPPGRVREYSAKRRIRSRRRG